LERGLGVDRDNPQIGLLQSDIANYSQRARELLAVEERSDGQLSLLQAKISPGVRRKTTEVQFRVVDVSQSPGSMLQWQSRSSDLSVEKKLLSDLGDFLKSREGTKSYSRAALNIPDAPKIQLLSGQDQERRIEMELNYDRAWAEVNRALSEAAVPVVDIDRSAGLFYVDYRTEEERDPGWFNWFSDPPKPEYTYLVSLDEQGETLVLKTRTASDFEGEDRSAKLLSELFEYLY
jgi:outer membrane protein assembly factor BamC